MTTRTQKAPSSRRSTRKSRSIRPRKAEITLTLCSIACGVGRVTGCCGNEAALFTKVSPGEPDEYRLETRLGHREIAQTARTCGLYDLRKQAVDGPREDAQAAGRDLHLGDLRQCAKAA